MDSTDLISVIIPTYNRAHLIKRSAESVLNQTYKNLECIIVDDGSTDNTKEVVNSLNDKRIVYAKQENQGAGAARNKGIELAKGKYIAFQDSDDVWHLNKLEKQIKILKEINADIVFCKIFIKFNRTIEPRQFKQGFITKNSLPVNIFPQTILGKAEVFKNNLFNTDLLEEFEILLRIQKKHSMYCIDDVMIDYYIQPDSISSKQEMRIESLRTILNNNKNFLTEYSSDSLELLAQLFIGVPFQIKDPQIRKKAFDLIFSISNSNKIKFTYLLHVFYKIKEIIYKSILVPIKNIISIFRKDT